MKRSKNNGKSCGGPECVRPSQKRGYCQTHYQQAYVYEIELRAIPNKVKCAAHWCERNCLSTTEYGLCNKCKPRFHKYELSIGDFLKLSGKCDICGSSKMWAIDHDHKTGAVRGILCSAHNLGLGFIGDDIESVKAVLNYLESANG